MLIRNMRIEDIPFVAALERDVFSEPWSEAGFAAALAQDGSCFLVAEYAGAVAARRDKHSYGGVVGYCGLYSAADEGEITNVAVAEDYRCQGVGMSLVEAVKEKACQLGVRQIFLEVRVSNVSAQSLYRKAGFQPLSIRKNFYRRPGEDALVMRCCF